MSNVIVITSRNRTNLQTLLTRYNFSVIIPPLPPLAGTNFQVTAVSNPPLLPQDVSGCVGGELSVTVGNQTVRGVGADGTAVFNLHPGRHKIRIQYTNLYSNIHLVDLDEVWVLCADSAPTIAQLESQALGLRQPMTADLNNLTTLLLGKPFWLSLASQGCNDPWLRYDAHEVLIQPSSPEPARDYHGAKQYCEDLGGTLFSIRSPSDLAFAKRALANTPAAAGNTAWIGAFWDGSGWHNLDGSSVAAADWAVAPSGSATANLLLFTTRTTFFGSHDHQNLIRIRQEPHSAVGHGILCTRDNSLCLWPQSTPVVRTKMQSHIIQGTSDPTRWTWGRDQVQRLLHIRPQSGRTWFVLCTDDFSYLQ